MVYHLPGNIVPPPPRPAMHRRAMSPATSAIRAARTPSKDEEFFALLQAFRATGGLARDDEVAARTVRLGGGNARVLARRIAAREVLALNWNHAHWLPCFQFDPGTMDVTSMAQAILSELGDVLDGWELAHWLVEANVFLQKRTPLSVLADRDAVLAAARVERFIVRG